jgi:short-subunit dehydrogenase
MKNNIKKTIVITGASSGIGLVTGEYLSKKGYKVIGLSRSVGTSEHINYISCDVTDKEQVIKAFNKIEDDIYGVINNAGMGISGAIEYQSTSDIEKIINVNLIGLINVCQVAIPYLRKTKGRIINIGSVAGELAIPFQTFYSMTKAAVSIFSEGLNIELKPFKIKVTTVLPGDTKTSFTKNREKTEIVNDLYSDRIKKSISKMEKDEQAGKDPITVSRVIYKVLRKKNPPIKVTVGLSYKLIVFLKRLLPNKLINYVLSKMYSGE